MSEDKKALLQKVVNLKLTKSRVELDLGMPTNSLSAMCKGKKELPDKYVEPLRKYVTGIILKERNTPIGHGDIQNPMNESECIAISGEPANNLEFKVLPGPVTTAIVPDNEKPVLDENGLPKSLSLTFGAVPFTEDELKNMVVTTIPNDKAFDCEKMPNNLIDEFPQWDQKGADDLMKLCSFLKSEGITPEQLIEGYKKGLRYDQSWIDALKDISSNQPGTEVISVSVKMDNSTNTPQGLSQAALDIRKKKLGY